MKTLRVKYHHLPKAAIGNERFFVSLHFGPENSKRKTYIQAGLHADEAPGYLVAGKLIDLLRAADEKGEILEEIIVVPAANPIGLGQWDTDIVRGRFDKVDQVNFNRHHEDLTADLVERIEGKLTQDSSKNIQLIRDCSREILEARTPLTEADHLKNGLIKLSHDADIVLDLHCDHQALLHIYAGTPLWPDCSDLSAQMGVSVNLLAEDSGDVPFDEANSKIWWELAAKFPEYPIPSACLAVTVELRGILDTDPDQTTEDADNIFLFLQRRGYIAGEAGPLPELQGEATPLEGVDYIKAGSAGILTFTKTPGTWVEKGDILAEIVDPINDSLTGADSRKRSFVKSSTAGMFFARSVDRFARPGKIVAKVAGKEALVPKGTKLLTS
ncbi:succinylglutamate desuccinylase/aspartoacylase family protein [Desulforhopalus sp. 52FAK]